MGRKADDAKVYWSKNGRVGSQARVIASAQSPDPDQVYWVDATANEPSVIDGGRKALSMTWWILKKTGTILFKLRRFLLSIPVLLVALRLAADAMHRLPQTVYFGAAGVDAEENLLINSYHVSKEFAVYVPLGLTFFCLMMMFFSKKVVYPWVISIMTLLIPIAIMLANSFA